MRISLFVFCFLCCNTILFATEAELIYCSKNQDNTRLRFQTSLTNSSIDSLAIKLFFSEHPKLKIYESQVFTVYRKRSYQSVWTEKDRIIDLGRRLHLQLGQLSEEGLALTVPYKEKLDISFAQLQDQVSVDDELELLLTALYFFYTQHVFIGIDDKNTSDLGWHIPRKKVSYVTYLDTIIKNPSLLSYDEEKMFKQYYNLKRALRKYRTLESSENWQPIVLKNATPIAVGTSAPAILQIRERLHLLGYLETNNNSNKYDKNLAQAVWQYKKNIGISVTDTINKQLVASLNIPIADRIKTLIFNMERCRWIPGDFNKTEEYIFINIPAYQMNYFKERKLILNSKVVVGKVMNQTVIFSGMMEYVVFSPYWNVPRSIIENEIKPAMKKNKEYLAQNNMEWNGGNIRQKPGPKNALGMVKFLFPNTNAIYLHDTPSKSLFKKEKRTFSHGCIRLEKPVELAYLLVKDDKSWTMDKLNQAFHSKKEIWYTLKKKIPVYIGYFTAWSDNNEVQFYEDVYGRDECLTEYLFEKLETVD